MANLLNAEECRLMLKPLRNSSYDKTPEWRIHNLGILADIISTHIIITGHYLGELYGYTPELLAKIKRDMKFYKIDETVGLTCGKDPTIV